VAVVVDREHVHRRPGYRRQELVEAEIGMVARKYVAGENVGLEYFSRNALASSTRVAWPQQLWN